jgi:hypothetical protein
MEQTTSDICWVKAEKSVGNGECIEIGYGASACVHVRDSKDEDGRTLAVSRAQFGSFLAAVTAGRISC